MRIQKFLFLYLFHAIFSELGSWKYSSHFYKILWFQHFWPKDPTLKTTHLKSKSILERLNLVKSKSISRESSEYPTVEKSVPPIGTRIILKWLNHWFSNFSLVFWLILWYEIKAESVRAPPKPIISCSNGPSRLIEDDLSFNLDDLTFSILISDWSIRFPLRELVRTWTRPGDPDQKGVVSSQ